MERHHDRHSGRSYEVEHVCSVAPAPDAVLVLDRDDIHATVVERSGRGYVVGPYVAPDAVVNFRRIRSGPIGWVEGNDLPPADRAGEVEREGRDAAAVRRIGLNKGSSGHRVAP